MRKLILLLLSMCFCGSIYSQWHLLNSQTSSDLNSIDMINASTGFATGSGGLILKTTNAGTNWSVLNSQTSQDLNSICFVDADKGLVCGNNGLIMITTNGGNSWSQVSSGVTDNLYSIAFGISPFNGVCCGSSGTLLFTSDGGANWTVSQNGFLSTFYSVDKPTPFTAYAGGVNTIFQPLLARSSDNGANWNYSSFYLNGNEGSVRDIVFKEQSVGFAVSNVWDGQGAISHTSNGGINWATQLYPHALNSLDFANSNVAYAVGYSGYILKTTDNGDSWIQQSASVSTVLKSVDFVDSVNGFACGMSGTIIKTTNGGITFVSNSQNESASGFGIFRGFPNPFNPLIRIEYELESQSDVSLNIYDMLGREVRVIENALQIKGEYKYEWDASDFPGGIYFCRLFINDYSRTLKLVLTK